MDWSSFSLGNAAGFIKGPGKQFDDILRSSASHITIGSITIEPREGNPGTVYDIHSDGTSINALGLPGPGLKATLEHASSMKERAERAGKVLRWSIAGFQPSEYGDLAKGLSPFGEIEVNLGCPNVWGDNGQKPIVAFNLDAMQSVINQICKALPRDTPYDLKVSPYSDPCFLREVANALTFFKPRAIITSNTFPNGVGRIDTPGGYGGIGGNALFRIALGQVSQFVDAFKNTDIKVIGVGGIGGIRAGSRLLAMEKAGATGVQIGTDFGERGARVFSGAIEQVVQLTQEIPGE